MFFFISIENIRLPDYKIWFLKGILSIPVSMVPFESIDFMSRLWFKWFKSIRKKIKKNSIWNEYLESYALNRRYLMRFDAMRCIATYLRIISWIKMLDLHNSITECRFHWILHERFLELCKWKDFRVIRMGK